MPLPREPEPEPMDLPREARAYAEADFAEVNSAFVERLLELLADRRDVSLIDLGTGPADIPVRIARLRPDWQITAVDVSEAMLDIARTAIALAEVGSQVQLVRADAKDPSSLPAGPFDAVISNSILHHLPDPVAFWQRVGELAAPDAWIFHRDLYRPDSAAAARAIVAAHAGEESELLRQEFHRSLLSAWTPQEIRGQLEAAGLAVLSVETINDRHVDVVGQMTHLA
jgi:2-polyprenyl-3-methyl-5-hydroxy-6-metoxy-1,4-benzoquinol methylase